MDMFPGPGAEIIRNEAGEPIGWDYPAQNDPFDDDEYWINQREADDYRNEFPDEEDEE
jgi:hypothetical protein